MDFDKIEYWNSENAVHQDISEQTNQTYHVFYLK